MVVIDNASGVGDTVHAIVQEMIDRRSQQQQHQQQGAQREQDENAKTKRQGERE